MGRSTWTTFWPRHSVQGVVTISRSPWQRGQVVTWTKEPRKVCCWRRTSPVPLHCGQRIGCVPGSAPLPWQLGQVSWRGTTISFSTAKDRFFKLDGQIVAQIGAPRRPAAGRRPGAHPAEKALKDVVNATKPAKVAKAAKASLRPGMAKAIVHRPLFPVRQDLVGLVDLFEPGLSIGVLVDVGMILAGQPAEGLFDLVVASPAGSTPSTS